jgi:hypothetical protein
VYDVISPGAGAILEIGNIYPIIWRGDRGGIYDVFLEESTGAGAGYIKAGLAGGADLFWKAGEVYDGAWNKLVPVPGDYRIRIRNILAPKSAEQTSAIFSIKAAPLEVAQVIPGQAVADGEAAVMIYGRNFDASTDIHLAGEYRDLTIRPNYRSADGRIVSFIVPTHVPAGRYAIYASSSYSSSVNGPRIEISVISGGR